MASYETEKENLVNRLSRIEGQVRGLQRMVEEDKYCVDILTQIAAVKGALNKVGMAVLEEHTHGCVQEAVANDNGDEIINELMDVINKFTK
ncbi:metal-sensing transcriptional repressor [Halanaerocella petrolearia]